jgi:hypothetical protein
VIQDTHSLQEMAGNPHFAREITGICDDFAALCLELHAFTTLATLLHRSFNTNSLAIFPKDLVDIGVEHVCTAVDGRKTCKSLWQLTKSIERVDVRGFTVPSHTVDVEADAGDCIFGDARCIDVVVSRVEGHAVANEVAGVRLKTILVVDFLHGARREAQSCARNVRYST